MNGVLGMLELLLDSDLNDEQRRYIEIANNSGESLLVLINDILDLSKIEAEKIELEQSPFELHQFVGGLNGMFVPRAKEKGLLLSFNVDATLPNRLVGDSARLRQVMINLIGNAVKFTDKGKVAVSIQRDGAVEESDKIKLHFEVSDSGVGIPEDKQDVIFSPFRQADGSTTRTHGGTGLGLTISRRLVELMGGILAVESCLGEGATFSFDVMLEIADAKPVGATWGGQIASSEPKRGKVLAVKVLSGKRVLLVEDNVVNRVVAKRMLTKMGLDVVAAFNGQEALDILGSQHVDGVLMDFQMPVMDGLEATRRFRKKEQEANTQESKRLPIIAMTANAMKGDREMCLDAGMDDYISKPVVAAKLKDILIRWLVRDTPEGAEGGDEEYAASNGSLGKELTVFDLPAMSQRLMDDQELIVMMLADFLDDAPPQLEALEKTAREGGRREAERHAHSLKGCAATVGGERMSELARQIEEMARNQNLAGAIEQLPMLKHEFGLLCGEIQTYLSDR